MDKLTKIKNKSLALMTRTSLSAVAMGSVAMSSVAMSSVAVLVSLSACDSARDHGPSEVAAFTNRPRNQDQFITVLKLKTPAILSSAHKNPDGTVAIDNSLKNLINAEQDSTIAKLQELSPDIKVIFRYRMVLNGLSIIVPQRFLEHFRNLGNVTFIEADGQFSRLEQPSLVGPLDSSSPATSPLVDGLATNNSASFIGAYKIRDELKTKDAQGQLIPVDGHGVRVGVIDTGIDYTHQMFGGIGTAESYNNADKISLSDGGFPSNKVVGGIDLVGSDYNSGSTKFEDRIPHPDSDPIDEGHHGTHVAGTIAGVGNGTTSYNGVAAGASLYAVKVFGKKGSTSDSVVIAGLEYSADPKGLLDGTDHLDVVNLSLGSDFGTPHILYNEAIANLTKGDTVVVASAGNAGEHSNIVGSPSTADEAISVAASIDNMPQNWQFRAVNIKIPGSDDVLAEALESTISKKITDDHPISGRMYYLGTAATEFTDEQKAALKDHVALIDRGTVSFSEKINRAAAAGALGIVVVNNQPGDAFTMGGDGNPVEVPAIMIRQELGQKIKDALKTGDVTIDFVTPRRLERPELIDTLTGFSSRGPRSVDGAIKPEIAAPGANIISAKMGSGNDVVKLSGTSMAAPHMTGVMALLKQLYPKLTVSQLKSLVISTALQIKDKAKVPYAVAFAGAGRVQAFLAATAPLTIEPATLSLGETLVESAKTLRRSITITNILPTNTSFTLKSNLHPGLTIDIPSQIYTLAVGASVTVPLTIRISPPASNDSSIELDGLIQVIDGESIQNIPVLAVANRTTRITAKNLTINATSEADAAGASANLTLINQGEKPGEALLFNLLAKDDRKAPESSGPFRGGLCDLQSVGWRIALQDSSTVSAPAAPKTMLEIAIKLYSPVNSWHLCEASLQIDADGDGIADQELLGTALNTLSENSADVTTFVSALTDANKMRSIRSNYEKNYPKIEAADYSEAIVDRQPFKVYAHSTLAIISADISHLKLTSTGDLRVKVAISTESNTPNADDFLDTDQYKWRMIYLTDNTVYDGLTDVTLAPGEERTIPLTRGQGAGSLVVYMPYNQSSWSLTGADQQSQIPSIIYAP